MVLSNRLKLPAPPHLLSMGLLAASCFFAGWLGSSMVSAPAAVLNPWACVGVGIAGMLVFGRQSWPGVLFGIWLAAFIACLREPGAGLGAALVTSFAMAVGKAVATVAGWEACARWLGGSRTDVLAAMKERFLAGETGVFKCAAVTLGCTLLGSVIGLVGACVWGLRPWGEFVPSLVAWWAGDASGVLVFTPFMVLVAVPVSRDGEREHLSRAERMGALVVVGLLAWLIFAGPVVGALRPFVMTLPLIWLALRAGVRVTVLGVMVVSVLAFWSESWQHSHSLLTAAGHASLEAVVYVWVMALAALTVTLNVAVAKHSRSALRLKDMQLAMITSVTPAMLNQLDAQERFIFANPSYLELVGLSQDQLLGKTIREVLGDEAYAQIRPHIERVFRGERAEFERESNRHPGMKHLLSVVFIPTKDASGQVSGWVGSLHDITERARGEERFRNAVEAAPSGMVMADEAGRIVLVNQHAERILGYHRDELIGQPVERLVPERFRAQNPVFPLKSHDEPNSLAAGTARELYALHKDGSEFPVEIGVSPIRTDEGVMVLSSIVDITDRKAAEEALRRLNDELESRVALRTKELATANADLQTLAEERRLLKNQILAIGEREERRLGMVLHEGIGQQIAGIGFLCNVVATRLKDEKHPQAETASQLVALLRETVDSIRDLAKSAYPVELETGGLAVAVSGLADRTAKMFHIHCEAIFDDDSADSHDEETSAHLYRIVQEAVINAIRHGRAKNIYIEQMHTADGEELRIVDDGEGFVAPAERKGLGLHLMDYRARLIGAKLTVARDGERGWVVRCMLGKPGQPRPSDPGA